MVKVGFGYLTKYNKEVENNMIKSKIMSGLLVCGLMASLAVPTFAADISTSGGSQGKLLKSKAPVNNALNIFDFSIRQNFLSN